LPSAGYGPFSIPPVFHFQHAYCVMSAGSATVGRFGFAASDAAVATRLLCRFVAQLRVGSEPGTPPVGQSEIESCGMRRWRMASTDCSSYPTGFRSLFPSIPALPSLPSCQAPAAQTSLPASRKSFILCSLVSLLCLSKFADHFASLAHTQTMIKEQIKSLPRALARLVPEACPNEFEGALLF